MLQNLVEALLKPINTTAIIILGALTTTWGLWVASPWWDAFAQAELYQEMNTLGEVFWGCLAIAAGAAMIYGALRPSYVTLRNGAVCGWVFWIIVAVFYFVGDWTNTGGVVSVYLAFYCAFIWLNITVNRSVLPQSAENLHVKTDRDIFTL